MTVSLVVAKKLKSERQRMGWRQDDFAAAYNTMAGGDHLGSRQAVSAWEAGKKQFSVDEVAMFARIYNTSIMWWFGETEGCTSAMVH